MSVKWLLMNALKGLRLIPMRRGKVLIARQLVRLLGDVPGGCVWDDAGNCLRVPSLLEPMSLEILCFGQYEPDTARMIRQTLRPGHTYVEVGANVGVLAVRAARCVGDTGHVYAVEASPRIYPFLKENLLKNVSQKSATPIHVAVTATDVERITFFEASDDKFGMGSLGSWPQGGRAKSIVTGRTLDTLHESWGAAPVSLIKVDVEGFERHVFEGAKRLLTGQNRPPVIFEFVDWAEANAGFSPGDAQRILREYGYQLWRLDEWLKRGQPMGQVIETGSEMIVASSPEHSPSGGAR